MIGTKQKYEISYLLTSFLRAGEVYDSARLDEYNRAQRQARHPRKARVLSRPPEAVHDRQRLPAEGAGRQQVLGLGILHRAGGGEPEGAGEAGAAETRRSGGEGGVPVLRRDIQRGRTPAPLRE